ncbi:MAG: invasion associated locus B family protein [Pseudomonadota bacterium]
MNPIQTAKSGAGFVRNALVASAVVATAGLGASSAALAQQQAPQGWVKVCSKVADNDICNVQINQLGANGQLLTGVNLLQSKGSTNRRIFQVAVPSARYIPEGVKIRIDNGKENTLPYSICLPDRCLAEIQLSEGLVKALKGGGELTLTSTNFRAQKNPVKVTLKGFTAVFDGPPLKRDEVQQRNKKIEEELKRKAKETADKLKAAQDAAKQGSN